MKTLLLIAQLLPTLIQLMKLAEEAMPDGGNGEAKLRWIREMLEATQAVSAEVWPAVERVIGATVFAFNTTGTFKK